MPKIFSKIKAFNDWIGLQITNGVGTMWCAYIFAGLAIWGAPGEIKAVGFLTWFVQSFIQLVLLSVIIVGQNIQAGKSEKRAIETHDAVMEELSMLRQSHEELKAAVDGQQR